MEGAIPKCRFCAGVPTARWNSGVCSRSPPSHVACVCYSPFGHPNRALGTFFKKDYTNPWKTVREISGRRWRLCSGSSKASSACDVSHLPVRMGVAVGRAQALREHLSPLPQTVLHGQWNGDETAPLDLRCPCP